MQDGGVFRVIFLLFAICAICSLVIIGFPFLLIFCTCFSSVYFSQKQGNGNYPLGFSYSQECIQCC